MSIAQTILTQLGGNKFRVMTGAKDFVNYGNGLHFRLPSNFAKNGINYIRITLTPADLYKVEFLKMRGMNIKTVVEFDNVYADALRELISEETGLALSL